MTESLKNIPRRRIMTAAAAILGVRLGGIRLAQAREKMSKQQAQYQDSPKDIRMCATCTLFEPPKSCAVVEGEVSRLGWCKAFALAD